MDTQEIIRQAMSELGKRSARKNKRDYAAMGKAGMEKRWGVRKEIKNATPPPSEKAKSNPKLTQNEEEPDAQKGYTPNGQVPEVL